MRPGQEARRRVFTPKGALALAAAWLVPVALATTQTKLRAAADASPVPWAEAFLFQLPLWSPLLLVGPIAFFVARRLPLDAGTFQTGARARLPALGRLLWVLGLGFLMAVVYLLLSAAVSVLVEGRGLSLGSVSSASKALAVRTFHLNLFIVGALIAAGYARENHLRAQAESLRALRLREQLSGARLSALKAQLRPHFLFNVLHSISALVDEDKHVAREMIVALSDLLRHTLGATEGQETTLQQELVSADLYLAIEEIRFADRLLVHRSIVPETLGARVPSLLLQPLLENAVLHGIEAHEGGGNLFLRAERQGEQLVLTVENSTVEGVLPSPTRGRGLGLGNTRARLQQLYGEGAGVDLRHQGSRVVVTVFLPFREHAPEKGASE